MKLERHHVHFLLKRAVGYTLIEMLLVVAILSILVSAGIYLTTNVRENSANTKLMRDVATVNGAVRLYLASGGDLSGVTDPQQVLNKMKRELKGVAAIKMAGMRGAMVDARLAVAMQTGDEASSSTQRAYWNPTLRQFVVANTGSTGIREFKLDETLATVDYGADDRKSSLDFDETQRWVWKATNAVAPDRTGPGPQPVTTPGVGPTPPGTPPTAVQLNPPLFSVLSGTFDLTTFPINLILTNPNPVGSSQIAFSVNGGSWRIYTTSLRVDPGQKIEGMAITIDPDKWSDSSKRGETYEAKPVTPVFALKFDKPNYSYIDLGGALMPGSFVDTKREKSGTLTLINGAEIPAAYQSSDSFSILWTYDGADPITSAGAQKGDKFSNGFSGQQIPLRLSDYGSATSVAVKAASKAVNTSIFRSSAIQSANLGIEVISLRTPLISEKDGIVTLAFQTDNGDMPVGARLYYTTDGSDPGNSGGNPTGGTQYTGPFKLPGAYGATAKVTARVYAPSGYLNWFTPSAAETKEIKIQAALDFYVGGNFFLTKGSQQAMRNIARLLGEGSVDPSFDVGKGASASSLVGIIRKDPAGKVFAGGDFESMNDVPRPGIVRLNPSGSVDASFDAALAGGK